MAGYTYNPAASIKQSFTEAKIDMGDIFAQVLQRQQRDYAVAENTFANIEALKKDLNIYGQKSVTQKANALLGNASQAILQNGKIDYSKMGEIRQAVSDIKDLKTGYALGGQEFDKWVQMGLSNKDNLHSFEMYYKDLMSKMSDENLIKNPRDLQVALSDTYTNNLDAVKMIGTSYLKSNPLYKVKPTDVIDPKTKAMVRVEGEMAAGWKPDGKGGLIEPDPVTITNPDGTQTTVTWKQQALAQVNATNPQAIPALRKQYGSAASGMSDEDLVAYAIRKIPMQSSAIQVKSAAGIQNEESQAKISASTANVADESNRLSLQGKRLSNTGQSLQNTGQRIQNEANQASLDELNNPTEGYRYDEKGRPALNFGSNSPKIDLPVQGTDKVQKVAVSEIGYDTNGIPIISYYVPKAGESVDDMIKNGMATGIRKTAKLPKFTQSQTYYNMTQGLGKKSQARTLKLLKNFANVTPVQPGGSATPASGTIDGDTIYLNKAYEGQEAAIKAKFKVTNVVYIN
jgi:hypothetical protein